MSWCGLRMDVSLSGLLSAFAAERRQWYAQQSDLLARIVALEGRLAEGSLVHLTDELSLIKIQLCHLRERVFAIERDLAAWSQSTRALWDFVTPDSPPAPAPLDIHCLD